MSYWPRGSFYPALTHADQTEERLRATMHSAYQARLGLAGWEFCEPKVSLGGLRQQAFEIAAQRIVKRL